MSHAVVIVAVDGPARSIKKQIEYEMAPFDENGECFGDGSRWDWWTIGGRWTGFFMGKDVIRRKDIDAEAFREFRRKQLIADYEKTMTDKSLSSLSPEMRQFVTDIKPDESLEAFLKRCLPEEAVISAYAFLRDRRWHENSRLGWWGTESATECEVKGSKEKVCIYRNEKAGSAIFNFNDEQDYWRQRYYRRFIQNLNPEKYLVAVDYHV